MLSFELQQERYGTYLDMFLSGQSWGDDKFQDFFCVFCNGTVLNMCDILQDLERT